MKTFKVLQFNMQYGQGWDDKDPDRAPVNLDLTLEEIRGHDADVVLLQEVELAQPGGVQADPPPNYTRLRAGLNGYQSHFAYPRADPRELPFGIGLAIFSRTPLRDITRRELPSPRVEFEFKGRKHTPTDRLLVGATTTVAGRDLRLFNTHLVALFMLNTDSTEYSRQPRLVVEAARASTGPTVVAGDFNVVTHEALIRQFAAAGYETVQGNAPTWRRHPYVLDHIFYNRHLRLVSHRVKPTQASDHHAIIAEFEFVDP
ncbi:MAG TPA: endonuclease/exonuclease/phosphatase family protein [Burkholderiales bacterium]|nr:endonuclease/exonuclease/phosphatase family protein [Burkholderiales bacterium]